MELAEPGSQIAAHRFSGSGKANVQMPHAGWSQGRMPGGGGRMAGRLAAHWRGGEPKRWQDSTTHWSGGLTCTNLQRIRRPRSTPLLFQGAGLF